MQEAEVKLQSDTLDEGICDTIVISFSHTVEGPAQRPHQDPVHPGAQLEPPAQRTGRERAQELGFVGPSHPLPASLIVRD